MSQKRYRPTILGLLVVVTIAGVAIVPLGAVRTSGTSTENATFREFVLPRLQKLLISVERVETMVEDRSRNILALQANAARIETLFDEIDDYLDTRDSPAEFQEVVALYRLGRDEVLIAIEGARSALASLDFGEIPSLIPRFTAGREYLVQAVSTLESTQGVRSSYTVSPDRAGVIVVTSGAGPPAQS